MEPHHILRSEGLSDETAQRSPKPLPRILLVDDDHDVLNLNADVLARAGYRVETAKSAEAAWETLKTNCYDALITDNTMPGMTGLDLIRKVRSEDMTLAVILASGTVPAEELNRSPWLHVNALLPKPYSVAELLRTVNQVLRLPSGAC